MGYFKNIISSGLLASVLSFNALATDSKLDKDISPIEKNIEKFSLNRLDFEHQPDFKIPLSLQTVKMTEFEPFEKPIDWTYTAGIIASTGAIMYIAHDNVTGQPWWPYRKPLHFEVDNTYQGGVDKFGHALTYYEASVLYQLAFKNANFSDIESRWLGFGFASMLQMFNELHDGRGPTFGFDKYDAIAGGTGALLPVLQGYIPILENVKLKWSYKPRTDPQYSRTEPWIKDVEYQKYWISVNLYKGFGIALGVNRSDFRNNQGHTQYYISPEFDITVLDPDSDILKALSFIKLPTLMIRLNDGKIFGNPYNNN